MFKLFPTKQKQTTNEIIEEIHETFYTEVDRLLEGTKVMKSLETSKQGLIDKCDRLKALGFTNTKEVKEAELEINRIRLLETENDKKQSLNKAIQYFSFKYPNYKFITEESVKKICAKYNLIYGAIDKYIGTVPDENLAHMENFKIQEEDECYFEEYRSLEWSGIKSFGYKVISLKSYKDNKSRRTNIHTYSLSSDRMPLEICAPIKDFDVEGMKVENFKLSEIEIPDPIVLKPVYFEGCKHYLIVTAWGIEANDETVVNQKMN